jgi:hypothetical protein
MKKLILALLAATTLGSALPAAAQDYPYSPFRAREAADAHRISWCVSTGAMSTAEAGRLYTELRQIERLAERLGDDGLSPGERFYIMRRLSQLERDINLHCLSFRRPYYEQERFGRPDPGPYRGQDRFDRYDRADRYHREPREEGRGRGEMLQLR